MGKSKSPALGVTEVYCPSPLTEDDVRNSIREDKSSLYCSLNVMNSTTHCSVPLQSERNGIDWEQQMVRNINTGAEH